jgi:hypothetical protein
MNKKPNPQGQRKAQARTTTNVDTEAIIKMREKLDKAKVMPETEKTPEDLDCEALLHILPDTWHNISWVIQNAVDQLLKKVIEDRVQIETTKEYALYW